MQTSMQTQLRAPKMAQAFTSRPQRRSMLCRSATLIRNLKVGDKAPDFTLKTGDGKQVKLSSYQGFLGKPVVLYFYPADNSPGCTKQAKAFKSSIDAFKKAGAVVLGISGQDAESKAAFSDKLGGIPFPLLVDEGDAVRKAFGVKKDLLGLLDGRETYVIGKDGTIKCVYNNQFDPESHVAEALEALSA